MLGEAETMSLVKPVRDPRGLNRSPCGYRTARIGVLLASERKSCLRTQQVLSELVDRERDRSGASSGGSESCLRSRCRLGLRVL